LYKPKKWFTFFYTPYFFYSFTFSRRGMLDSWSQTGSVSADSGTFSVFDDNGVCRIQLPLTKRNGLYYSSISALALDNGQPLHSCHGNRTIYLHDTDSSDDDVSLVLEPTAAATLADLPTTDPRRQQIEADLWQARLGHCSEWQFKVLIAAADGLPTEFTPHPFASYDHYNRARIQKIPATKGKHPSWAVAKQHPTLITHNQTSLKIGLLRLSMGILHITSLLTSTLSSFGSFFVPVRNHP
jgi:hypothetical protein